MLLSYFLRRTNTDDYVDLADHLIQWPQKVTHAAEEKLLEFRGTQIALTLRDQDGMFGLSTGAHYLQGGEEISAWIGNTQTGTIVWSGTIDSNSLSRDPIQQTFSFRVLQAGSELNTVYAGLPDWYFDDDGNLVVSPTHYYRWKGRADQWRRGPEYSDRIVNQITTENTDVFYTPTAKHLITDPVYNARFSEKVYHFHTANRMLGGVETPFSSIQNSDGDNRYTPPIWTGQFQPHYHPDLDRPANEWTDHSLVQDKGSYTRTPEPQHPFIRHPIASLILELVSQFNRTAKFPLAFDSSQDAVILPPKIEQAIEVLERDANIEHIDLWHRPSFAAVEPRTFALVTFKTSDGHRVGSLYSIDNETELTPVIETLESWNQSSWASPRDCFRFARTMQDGHSAGAITTYVYQLRHSIEVVTNNVYGATFDVEYYSIINNNLYVTGPLRQSFYEQAGEFLVPNDPEDVFEFNRSARFLSGTTPSCELRDSAGNLNPPEIGPFSSAEHNNRVYNSARGGITVSGALFDRVGFDAEDQKISQLLSALAELTHSRWWVTPDRRLKFISRQHGPALHNLSPKFLNLPLRNFQRTFEDVPAPALSNGLVLPDNYKKAHQDWFESTIQTTKTPGTELTLRARDLPHTFQIGDHLVCDDSDWPELPDSDLTRKHGRQLQIESITYDDDNEQLELTAVLPAL